jgi:hypothetical protein
MSMPLVRTCFLGALLVAGLMTRASGAPDDFQLALNEAKERLIRYRTASRSNDRAAIHEAALRLQEDPLAVRQLGASQTGITKDIEALQNEVRERILVLLDESGIRRDRVSFFNVLQPPWDTGFRVDLRVVPTRVSQPFAREAYYELATGQKPPGAADQAARAEYRAAAIQYGGQLAAAWAGTSYFDPNDDRLVAAGVKDARLRGPVPAGEYTSPEALQLASDLRADGRLGATMDQEIEELKLAMRQFDAQARPAVEAAGTQVPQELAEAREIVRQVEAGTMTPPQARERIAAIGQTPAGITRRAADGIDRVQVLLPPVALPPAAGVGAPPLGVFNANVVQRLIGRRIAALLQRLDAGLLTVAQARAQLAQINAQAQAQPAAGQAPPPAGAVPQGQTNNFTALLRAAAAAQTTPPAGAADDPARWRAAGAAMADVAMAPLPPLTGDVRNAQATNNAAGAGNTRQAVPLSEAIRRRDPDAAVWTLPSQINQNELADEELRAVAENRPPLYPDSMLNGALAGPGERLLLDAITRSGGRRGETILPGSREELAVAWARSRLVEAILVMAGITRDFQWHTWSAELTGADLSHVLAKLAGHYNNARLAMADLSDRAAQRLGDTDPLVLAFQKKVSRLPDPPKVPVQAPARPPEVAGTSFLRPNNSTAGTLPAPPNQNPKPATTMPPTPPVAPVKAAVKVPDVTKLLEADAEKKIAELKLKLVVNAGSDKPPRTAKKGEVYRQSPPAGSEVVEGDTIRLDYYAGIPVGKYVGLKKAEAEAAIQKDGLTARVREGDAGQSAVEALQVYEQRPQPGDLAWFDDEVSIVHHKAAEEGFADGDGAKVDPRLAAAKVHDGGDPTVACYKLSEGKRCIIALPTPKIANMQTASQTWAIVRYPNAAGAQAWYNENAVPMTANQNMAGHRETLTRDPAGGVIYSRNMNLGGYKSTDHIRIAIYREVFIIMYGMHEPQPAADVSHAAGIMERSRKLVDERFPKP